jgi:hypothetical protein
MLGPRQVTRRVVIFACFAVAATILAIAATATPIIRVDTQDELVVYTPWRKCTTLKSTGDKACEDWKGTSGCKAEMINAVRAFDILSVLTALSFCGAMVVVDLYALVPSNIARYALGGSAGVAALSSMLACTVAASLWINECGGAGSSFKDMKGASLGPSVFIMGAAWGCTLVMMATGLLVRGRDPHLDQQDRGDLYELMMVSMNSQKSQRGYRKVGPSAKPQQPDDDLTVL